MTEREDPDDQRPGTRRRPALCRGVACGADRGCLRSREADPGQANPKHVRHGLNSCFVNDEGLATLLIAKGIITRPEYHEAIADAAERERARYEKLLTERFGKPVTLG